MASPMSEAGRLAGKTALVTGAARGIGAATVRRLSRDGALVTGVDIVAGEGVLVADVTDPQAMAASVEAAARGGRLDICVANAGIFESRELLQSDLEHWERIMRVNVIGAAVTLQAAMRSMVASEGGGRLLASVSIAAWHGTHGSTAYCASKAALTGLIPALALEAGPYGITVNGVAPGTVDTEGNLPYLEKVAATEGISVAEVTARRAARIPLRRVASPEDIANVFALLASDDAGYITGEVVRADGGLLIA